MADDPKPGAGSPPPADPKADDPKPGDAPKPDDKGDGTPPPDPKAADAKPGDKDGTPPAEPKVPEKYAFAVPAGAEVFFEDIDLAAYGDFAKANKLTQEEAQEMIVQEAAARTTMLAAFETATKADPTYGGAKLSETQQLARKAIERVRPAGHVRAEAFNKLLAKTGYGNHIEVVSFLADLGKLMAEDQPAGGRAGEEKRSAQDVLYGGKA